MQIVAMTVMQNVLLLVGAVVVIFAVIRVQIIVLQQVINFNIGVINEF